MSRRGPNCCCGCTIYDLDFSSSGNWESRASVEPGTSGSTQLSDALRLDPGARLHISAVGGSKVPFMVIPTMRTETAVRVPEYHWEIEEDGGVPEETVEVTLDTSDGFRISVELLSSGEKYYRPAPDPTTSHTTEKLTVAESQYYAGRWTVYPLHSTLESGSEIVTSDRDNPQASVSLVLENDSSTGIEIESLLLTKADTPDAIHHEECPYGAYYSNAPTEVDNNCPAYPVACAVTADTAQPDWGSVDVTLPDTTTINSQRLVKFYCQANFGGERRDVTDEDFIDWYWPTDPAPTFSRPQYVWGIEADVSEHPTDCDLLLVDVVLYLSAIRAIHLRGSDSPEVNVYSYGDFPPEYEQLRMTYQASVSKPYAFAAWPEFLVTSSHLVSSEVYQPLGGGWSPLATWGASALASFTVGTASGTSQKAGGDYKYWPRQTWTIAVGAELDATFKTYDATYVNGITLKLKP